MLTINKRLMALKFKRALTTYDNEATIQQQMAEFLITNTTNKIGNNFSNLLEIGCGTGLLTKQILSKLEFKKLYVNDIVPDYKFFIQRKLSPHITFIPGDAESITIFPTSLELIISNATFQWFHHLPETLLKLKNLLTSNGYLVFSTLGPDTFKEITQLTNIRLSYFSWDKIKEILQTNFEIIFSKQNILTRYFSVATQILEHIKALGVNSLPKPIWSKKTLQTFKENYTKTFTTPYGLPLTYQPQYFILRSK